MSKVAFVFLATLACVGALKSKAKPRAHVDTCLEANTHLFLGLNGENIQAQMPYVEEACDASKGCAMFKKSEIAFHRNVYLPDLRHLMRNPYLKEFDFEVCLPQTSCLEEEFSTGAVVYSAQCRYDDHTGQRFRNHVPGGQSDNDLAQGCNCGLQQCIDQCVDADTNERDTITCATYCQDQLTESMRTFLGNFMCEAPKKSHWIGFRQAAIKMSKAHNEWVLNYKDDGLKRLDAAPVDLEAVQKDASSYFYDCEKADMRPSKYIAKSFGLPNWVGDGLHWLGITNKY